MGDVQRMIETQPGKIIPKQFPKADHYAYYLMRTELLGEDLNRQSAHEILDVLRNNWLRQSDIHETLRGDAVL